VLRALEKVGLRTTEVLYKMRNWYQWVRQSQEEEEKTRENEQKKVKKEAALFKRQRNEIQRRMRQLRAEEDARRQEEFLEKAFQERKVQDEDWDPMNYVTEDERGTYIGLIKYFLWLDNELGEELSGEDEGHKKVPQDMISSENSHEDIVQQGETSKAGVQESTPIQGDQANRDANREAAASTKKSKKKKRVKKASHATTSHMAEIDSNASTKRGDQESLPEGASRSQEVKNKTSTSSERMFVKVTPKDPQKQREKEPDIALIESREEVRRRLVEGVKIDLQEGPIMLM
jgi:hypothetical protein